MSPKYVETLQHDVHCKTSVAKQECNQNDDNHPLRPVISGILPLAFT